MAFDIEMIRNHYDNLDLKISKVRSLLNRPLTASEKILYSHIWKDKIPATYKRGVDYVNFAPDRIACQDATAQMA